MKASELVNELNNMITQHGDVNVFVRDHVEGNDFPMGGIVFKPQFKGGYFINTSGQRERADCLRSSNLC